MDTHQSPDKAAREPVAVTTAAEPVLPAPAAATASATVSFPVPLVCTTANNSVDTPSDCSTPPTLPPAADHPSFQVLKNGRMSGLKKQADRVQIFLDAIKVEPIAKLLTNEVVDEHACNFISSCKGRRSWTNEGIAEAMCTLDHLRKQSLRVRAESRPSKAVRVFDEFMVFAAGCALTKKDREAATATNKTTGQQRGILVQYSTKFDEKRLASHSCPACGHSNVMEIGMTQQEITAFNNTKKEEHRANIEAWKSEPKATRGARPNASGFKCQEYACFCCISFCSSRNDGGQCRLCKAAYVDSKKGVKNAIGKNTFLRDDMTCSCLVCNCNCSVKYSSAERERRLL